MLGHTRFATIRIEGNIKILKPFFLFAPCVLRIARSYIQSTNGFSFAVAQVVFFPIIETFRILFICYILYKPCGHVEVFIVSLNS